ncbi:hypothetical protein PMAYCL1PPCAC_14826, partial [Pristionchus mayeri]
VCSSRPTCKELRICLSVYSLSAHRSSLLSFFDPTECSFMGAATGPAQMKYTRYRIVALKEASVAPPEWSLVEPNY